MFEKQKAFQTENLIATLAIIFTVLIATFLVARILAAINCPFPVWILFICIPFPFYLALTHLRKISRYSYKINPVLFDHLQLALPLLLTILFLRFTGGNRSNFKIIFLLPVILYSLRFGVKWGYAVSLLSSFTNLFFYLNDPVINFLEEDIILSGIFFLFSWFIGNIAELEYSIKNQLTQKVTWDELTGFYSYRYFRIQLKKMIAAHKEENQGKIGLIMLDLDNYKLYSKLSSLEDRNNLLQKVARVIKDNLSEKDFAARYDKDEFVIVVPCEKTAEVVSKAEKIKKEVIVCQEHKAENSWRLTASAGVALVPDHAMDFPKLLQRTEEALQKAKIMKGNRVQLYYPLFAHYSANREEKAEEFLRKTHVLLSVVQARDNYTYAHSERVLIYTQLILKKIQLPPLEKSALEYAALFHDIGKIKITGAVLTKSKPYTPAELNIWRQHPLFSGEIIKSLIKTKDIVAILPPVIHHHERFDGQGFPNKLKGRNIPLGARIIAVVNAFDNLTAKQPLIKGETIKEGIALLGKKKGSHFDPHILEVFASCLRRYIGISQLIAWPEDLRRLVPAGYLPGAFLLGCHYTDFYKGNLHFIVKATTYLSAALANGEKFIYYMGEKSEEIFLEKLKKGGAFAATMSADKQLAKMTNLENLWKLIHKARFPWELKRILKEMLDQAQVEGFTSLRILLDGSALPLLKNELLLWEKSLAWSIKDLEVVVVCLYNVEQEDPETCHLLEQLHDKPLLNSKEEEKEEEETN